MSKDKNLFPEKRGGYRENAYKFPKGHTAAQKGERKLSERVMIRMSPEGKRFLYEEKDGPPWLAQIVEDLVDGKEIDL